MIPNYLILTLLYTLFLIMVIFCAKAFYSEKIKTFWIITSIVLFYTLGVLWGYVIFNFIPLLWLKYVLTTTLFPYLIILFGTVLTYDFVIDENKKDNKPNEIKYTLQTLIGMRGTIINVYLLSENLYLGYLFDEEGTNIIVKIEDENVQNGSIFEVTELKNGRFTAILTGNNIENNNGTNIEKIINENN